MIFYFTGTGNSEYAARRIARRIKTDVISIGGAMRAGVNSFSLADGEPLGFVFPVYAWSVPDIVKRFIKGMTLENYNGQYVFAVFTCGASIGNTYGDLKKILAEKGIGLNYARDLLMPENYIVMFKPASPEKQEKIFAAASAAMGVVAKEIALQKEGAVFTGRNPAKIFSLALNRLFSRYAFGTKKFYVTGDCTSCKRCAKLCPESAIVMEGGRPRWHKESCAKCMACINRCPAQAIEYGKSTQKRRRYVHPIYRKRNGKNNAAEERTTE